MSRIILHVDLNAFFVRCEEIKDPTLKNKPVAIGRLGRGGIISTCSYAARKYGVRSGMPTFQAVKLCPHLILRDIDGKFIQLMSNEFFSYLKTFTNKIEILGCDECFLDFTELYKKNKIDNIESFLMDLQYGLLTNTSLECSIGVGPTKFLAKMGSDYKKPMGITIIRKKDIKNMLFPLDIKDFYGIGKQTQQKLYRLNIRTIGDLYNNLISTNLLDEFGDNFKEYVLSCLEGRSDNVLNLENDDPKSIGTTRTLYHDTNNREEIRTFLIEEVRRIVNKMKEDNMMCKTITITYKDAEFTEKSFKTVQFSKSFKDYTDDLDKIINETNKLFNSSYKDNLIRLIGFTVKNLIDKYEVVTQMTFDNYEIHEKENETYLLINKINREFNKEVVKRTSDLKKGKR